MADIDLPISGKDVRMQLLVNGIPIVVVDQITSLTERRKVTQIDTKVIGTSTVFIDQEPEGWEGDIELAPSTTAMTDLIDAIDAAQRARLPNSLQIVVINNYRNATSKSYMYPDVKLQYENTTRRGQAVQTRVPWTTGLARIAL